MIKKISLLTIGILLLFFISIPTYTMADFYVIPVNNSPLKGTKKSICDFPYWNTSEHKSPGNFEVRYDPRSYDPDYYTPSQNELGGIVLDLWLGTFTSSVARDAIVDKISKFVLFNNDTDHYYEVNEAETFDYLGDPSASYGINLGHQSGAKGTWDIVIVADGKKYAGSFTLTQAMFSKAAPIAVDPTVTSGSGQFLVTASATNGEQYRLRLWDANYNIVYQENMANNAGTLTSTIPQQYADFTARIETRIYTNQWLALMNWNDLPSCNASGGVIGAGTARNSIWFKIQVVGP